VTGRRFGPAADHQALEATVYAADVLGDLAAFTAAVEGLSTQRLRAAYAAAHVAHEGTRAEILAAACARARAAIAVAPASWRPLARRAA
jgi:hypothetical protein